MEDAESFLQTVGESSTQYEDSTVMMTMMATTQQPLPTGLSDVQEMVLAILPVPSAILSIFGSTCIIYMSLKSRFDKSWTPYTRLLIGMSICDIISSLTLAVAAFMRPQENGRVWAFGSEATCSAIGLLTQFSYSGLFYNSMLSLYFLLSTRFKLKNQMIAKRFEPLMHFLSLGFPIVTAVVGAIMGVYSTTTSELGCWVNDFPRGCIGEECLSITIGWYYFGMPFLISFAIIGLSNLNILIFVRQKTKKSPSSNSSGRGRGRDHSITAIGDLGESFHSKSGTTTAGGNTNPVSATDGSFCPTSPTTTLRDSSNPQDGSAARYSPASSFSFITMSGSFKRQTSWRSNNHNNNINKSRSSVSDYSDADVQRQQMKRLRLILSQALLFVASYIFTAGWLGLLRIIESMAETPEDELRMVHRIYPLMVINAIMAPLQGLFNMLVFIRPKYLKWRNEYPMEKRSWVFQRCIFGRSVRPTVRYMSPQQQQQQQQNKPARDDQTNQNDNHSDNELSWRKSRDTEDEEHEDGNDEKVVLDKKFHFPRSMASSLTASIGDFDHVLPEGQTDERWQASTSARNRWHSLHSSVVSSLEVISELSVSLFESHYPTPGASGDDDNDNDDEVDEMERTHTDDDDELDLEASLPRPPLLKTGSNHSEDRWSASSPPPTTRSRSSPIPITMLCSQRTDPNDSADDRWSTASPRSDRSPSSHRSPTLHRGNRSRGRNPTVRNADGTAGGGSVNSSDNRSDGRWSSSSARTSPLQQDSSFRTTHLEMPRRLVSEQQSEFNSSTAAETTILGGSIAESSVASASMTTDSNSSGEDTPLQPPTRRLSPGAETRSCIPDAPIL